MLRFWKRLAGGVIAIISVVAVFGIVSPIKADDNPNWTGDSGLNLHKETGISATPNSLNGNIDCQPQTSSSCSIPTLYGMASSDGKVLLNHAPDYYTVFTNIDNQQHFQAIPNSNTVLSYVPSPAYGAYYYFNHNFSTSINKLDYYDGQPTYKYAIDKPPDGQLGDKDGHLLAGDYESISFSSDGHWMVISVPNVTMLRVNLDTLEVTPFAHGFDYTIGLDPNLQTAITNDGRYAVVASKGFGFFKIYDLSTCGAVPSTITGPLDCQSRDLENYAQEQIGGFINASNIRFITDDTLGLYATYSQDSSQVTAKYLLSTPAGGRHQLDYLAMGDSYISGEGAYDYVPGTDTDDNKCHVSLQSYPQLLSRDLEYNSYQSVACSGTTVKDVLDTSPDYSGQTVSKIVRNQRNVEKIISNFLPGYIDQLDFVSQYQPKVITLSVGGNDMGFSSILRQCVMPGTCYESYEDRLELVQEINSSVFPKLVNTYQQIKQAGALDARIYVIGYPQIAKPGGDCADNVHLNEQEVEFSAELINYLDKVVQAAAARAGVIYVDTQDALDGHRLCEAQNKYSIAVNGLTAGNDRPESLGGPIADESYHPNFIGHQLLEQAVMIATNELSEPMPASVNLAAAPPAITGLEILDAKQNGRPVNTTEYDSSISDDVIFKDSVSNISVEGIGHSLAPATNLHAELHSTPIDFGTFTTDSNGNLSAQIVIPDTTPPGYHSLHFYGTDFNGQSIDIYKTLYLAGSQNDVDSNGVPDNQDICVGVEPSGNDIDKDSIDDSCDGFISEPPQVINASAGVAAPTQIMSSAPDQHQSDDPHVLETPKILGASTLVAKTPVSDPTTVKNSNVRVSPIYLLGFGLMVAAAILLAFASKD